MKFSLEQNELVILEKRQIDVDVEKDYSIDEALDILERVRDLEVEYSQDIGTEREKFYYLYGDLADKMQDQIDDD